MMNTETSGRVDLVDSLRGFAILGILLMHSIEHFNFYLYPTIENEWLALSDTILNSSLRFALSGKVYTIFSLLFGFSFFIQDNNQLKKGYDFRLRFLWRLVLLAMWGFINVMFYTGDVLVLFAFVGLLLLATARLSNKVVLYIAVVLLLQPVEWGKIIYTLMNPDFVWGDSISWQYYLESAPVLKDGNLWETMKMGLTSGIGFGFGWWIEDGRVFQIAGLFLIGMLMGRRGIFLDTPQNIRFWKRTLVIGVLCYFPLAGLHTILMGFIENKSIHHFADIILTCYSCFAFFTFLTSLFVLAYYRTNFHNLLTKLAPYGKMSLTMYLSQSILGGFAFHNWGLGLYTLSTTATVGIGLLIFAIQYTFACWWLKSHKQGPLEYVWGKLMWIGSKR